MPEKRGGGGWGGVASAQSCRMGGVLERSAWGRLPGDGGEGGKGQVRAAGGPAETRPGGGA